MLGDMDKKDHIETQHVEELVNRTTSVDTETAKDDDLARPHVHQPVLTEGKKLDAADAVLHGERVNLTDEQVCTFSMDLIPDHSRSTLLPLDMTESNDMPQD